MRVVNDENNESNERTSSCNQDLSTTQPPPNDTTKHTNKKKEGKTNHPPKHPTKFTGRGPLLHLQEILMGKSAAPGRSWTRPRKKVGSRPKRKTSCHFNCTKGIAN